VTPEPNPTRSEQAAYRVDAANQPTTWLFHVFSCDDPTAPLGAACQLDDHAAVTLGRGEPGAAPQPDGGLQLTFADPWMSTQHARLERGLGGYWLRDERSKNGVRVNGERTERALLVDGDWIEAGRTVLRFRHGALPPSRRPRGLPRDEVALATALPTLDAQARDLEDIARSPISVVLRGETGTGKEVVARAVHRLSGRPGELIAINCGALPAALLEAELFGYRKGAFSSATEDRPGLVRAADRGTLFLDEIGELPPSSQVALLRVLQEREVRPLGATRPVKVDLRVLCATHRDLRALVALGQFRSDLYARLAGHLFEIPPLRERREDLGLLTAALLPRIAPGRAWRFEPDAVRALCRHDWPLNVRELEKCLASAVVLAREGPIGLDHVSAALVASVTPPLDAPAAAKQRRADRRHELITALQAHRGNVSAVARALGKARSQVQRWLHDYGLDPTQYRGS
jgi:DNA-binding NtrC family response regulator